MMWERVCDVLESCDAVCGIEHGRKNAVDNGEKYEVRTKGEVYSRSSDNKSADNHTMNMNPPHNPPPPRNGAHPPPPSSRLPPPRYQPSNNNAPSSAAQQQHAATTEVDSAIAQRRAELRRLQERRGRPAPPPAYAAGRNGGVGGGTTPQNSSMTPIAPSTRDTPSTAAIARRLDNSYGPPVTVRVISNEFVCDQSSVEILQLCLLDNGTTVFSRLDLWSF